MTTGTTTRNTPKISIPADHSNCADSRVARAGSVGSRTRLATAPGSARQPLSGTTGAFVGGYPTTNESQRSVVSRDKEQRGRAQADQVLFAFIALLMSRPLRSARYSAAASLAQSATARSSSRPRHVAVRSARPTSPRAGRRHASLPERIRPPSRRRGRRRGPRGSRRSSRSRFPRPEPPRNAASPLPKRLISTSSA